HAFVSPQEGTVPRGSLEVNPAILKLARSVVRTSRHRTFVVRRDQQPRLEKHLKSVADPEDQPVRIPESPQAVAQEVGKLRGQNLARCHVVPIREPARNDQNLVALQEARLLAQPIDVHAFGSRPRLLKSKLGLAVAIRTRSTKNQGPCNGHGRASM